MSDDPRFYRLSAEEEASLWFEVEAAERELAELRAEYAEALAREMAEAEAWEAAQEERNAP
jgi:hypothetical protein